ncbi:MAG TPA: ankyrin repeat domain-containing protein [Vicinamibacterales bacterium]|nr:ankyrin repeat domain-containing protein [Vicinamibacterales bacterium]
MRFWTSRLVVAVLLALGASPAFAQDLSARLATAAANRDTAAVRALLAQKVDVNAPDVQGTPALHWAIRVDDIDIVRLLLSAGADAKLANRYGLTPLTLAVTGGNPAIIRLMLDAGADPNAVDPAAETMLMIAARVGVADAVRMLLDRGAAVDARDKTYQQTALMVAVRENHPAIVQMLIERGADVNAKTRTGATPQWVLPNSVPGFGHGIGIVRGGLPPRGSRQPIPGSLSPLLYAARDGRLEVAKLLLANKAEINQTDANGITPLIMAIVNNRVAVAKLLLEQGADIHATDWYGRTPLWAAVETRNMDVDNATFVNSIEREPMLEVISILLERGAKVNVRMKEVPPIRRSFLRVTGSLEWVDFTGQTPFLTASRAADLTVMRLLLKHGADPNIGTFEGTTPLMAAAGVNWVYDQTFDEGPAARLEAVKLCHELGNDVNAVNSMGLTALMGAANRGSDDIIKFLVEKGAKLDLKDKEGRTAFTWAEGVFLATHPAKPKPSSMALIKSLMGPSTTLGAGPPAAP